MSRALNHSLLEMPSARMGGGGWGGEGRERGVGRRRQVRPTRLVFDNTHIHTYAHTYKQA